MCVDDPEAVADSLDRDIVVAGPREDLETSEGRAELDDQPRVVCIEDDDRFGDAVRDAGVVVVAMDGSSSAADSLVRVVSDAEGFVVAVFDGHEDIEPSLFEAVRETVDVTVLAGKTQPTVGGAFDFVRMIRRPGHVNLDLADARTVLTDGSLAVLGGGTASFETEGPRRAVRRASEEIPSSIGAVGGSGALVSVAGGPEMSIGDAIAAVRIVREEFEAIDDIIWGVAVEETLADRVTVDIVVDDVVYRPSFSAGDPCRRCGAALVEYTFGEQRTLACEVCGFADLSTSLGDRAGHDAGR